MRWFYFLVVLFGIVLMMVSSFSSSCGSVHS